MRRKGNHFVTHATLPGRLTSGPGQALLGWIFFLKKATSFGLEPLQPARLVQWWRDKHRLYSSTHPRVLKQRAFDFFYAMCHRVPVYRMRFLKNYVDWDAVDAAVGDIR